MDDEYILLLTSDSEFDAKIIESKLKFYGIECVLQNQGMGSYLSVVFGYSNMPVDIFVSKDKIDEAKGIMKETPSE